MIKTFPGMSHTLLVYPVSQSISQSVSACLPSLFLPLQLKHYPDQRSLRLQIYEVSTTWHLVPIYLVSQLSSQQEARCYPHDF